MRTGQVVRRTALNIVIGGAAEVLGKVATLAWTVLAARLLTREEFGAVSYGVTLMLVVSALPAGGFDAGVIRRGSAHPESLRRVYAESIIWKTALFVPVLLATALVTARTQESRTMWLVLLVFVVSGLPELWSSSARSASAARQRPAGTSTALVVQRVATAAAIGLALVLGLGPLGIATAFLLGTLTGWGSHVLALRSLDVTLDTRTVTREDLRSLLSETWVIGLSGMVLMLLFRADGVLLQALAGYEAVADYSVAYRLLETVLFVTFAINQAILPVMSAANGTERIRRGYERGLAAACFVYLPFAATCFTEGDRLITLVFGEAYADTSPTILNWLVLAPVLYTVAFFGTAVFLARQQPTAVLVAAATATTANIALNLWLIPRFGGVGAAIATTTSYGVQALATYVALRRRVTTVKVVRPVLEPAAAAVVMGLVLALVRLPLFGELAVGAAVYLATWLCLARWSAPEQVDLLRQLLARRRLA